MLVLAINAAWVGVVGVAVGGLLSFMSGLAVHRWERADRIAERSRADKKEARAERKEAYSALLTHTEDSMHLFQWLAEGQFSLAGAKSDRDSANTFYDHEVTARYMVLKILIDKPEVLKVAQELRSALNDVRHVMVDSESPPSAESTVFETAQGQYRAARDTFIEVARADLLELNEGPSGEPNTMTP